MKRKRGLTREEHFALGRQLQTAHEIITAASVQISHAYPLTSREAAAINKLYRDMIQLKYVMDEAVHREAPSNVTSFRAYYLRHDENHGDAR